METLINNSRNKYTIRDVAQEIHPDMTWENEHFSYCSIHCSCDQVCPAAFYFDGDLRLFCINKDCCAKDRIFRVPESALQIVAGVWNGDE